MGNCGGERLGIGTNKTNARGTASPGGEQQSQAPVERFALAFCNVEGAELDHAAGATG
jgi:hypothetical protein